MSKKVFDNKTFWKSVKPFLLNKGLNSNNILLVKEIKWRQRKNSSYYKQVFCKYK